MSPLWSGLAVTLAAFVLLWLASLVRRDASLVDRWWGMAFVLLGTWYLQGREGLAPLTSLLLLSMVTLWGLRLSLHLTIRNWGTGEDYRYAAMRARHGARFPLVSLGTVFLLQGVLAWVIGMPLFAGIAMAPPGPPVTWLTQTGFLLWGIGTLMETVADLQLAAHRRDPARRDTVLQDGLWRYSRHPNYFGDAVAWWGMYLVAASVGGGWTIFAPALMTLLLVRVSGVTLLEQKLVTSRPGYREYVERTNAFVPGPPRR